MNRNPVFNSISCPAPKISDNAKETYMKAGSTIDGGGGRWQKRPSVPHLGLERHGRDTNEEPAKSCLPFLCEFVGR